MSVRKLSALGLILGLSGWALVADVVPTDVEQPGTQPREVASLETPDRCDNCHGGYDLAVEPAFNWRGSMMANAGRDPLFWATVAIVEQDFLPGTGGAGDLCIRCHSPDGWLDGRSTPTDGSGLMEKDSHGVQCDLCHTMVNPDGSEPLLPGVQIRPYLAHDEGSPPVGYYGSGMFVMSAGGAKLGPYSDATARHQADPSLFHRDKNFCGTCHDVSNPAVGNLAPNNGTQPTADPVTANGALGGAVDGKAAFNNFPYQYGIVERTFSEFIASGVDDLLVSDYGTLPADLQGGALLAGYQSATATPSGPDYVDGALRYYTCQTCHLRPVQGAGCNKKGVQIRDDLPLHDMTGGNYWVPDAIQYLDGLGQLRLGGGLTTLQIDALNAGKTRALKQLSQAATLTVDEGNNTVRIVNHTGHKLISGYPEGRRLWLNIKWYDANGVQIHEDGAYGDIDVQLPAVAGRPARTLTVRSILDLGDPNTKIYEAQPGMTQDWAATLRSLQYPAAMPLSFDRLTGQVTYTLDDLATSPAGTAFKTFHFVLNNTVVKDNRIPPYNMSYDEARARNALPAPATQFGNPGTGGVYDYFDVVSLKLPTAGGQAVYAEINLLYQPTSWEYIQFLYLANDGSFPFLADEGLFLLDAWLNTTMAEPYVMATAEWGKKVTPPAPKMHLSSLATWCVDRKGNFTTFCTTFAGRETVGYAARVRDIDGALVSGAQVFTEIRDEGGGMLAAQQAYTDATGEALFTWKVPRNAQAGIYSVVVTNVIHGGYEFDPANSIPETTFVVQ
jgi:hypothetical protein